MIRQKRNLALEFNDNSNEERSQFTVADLRAFLKAINDHGLPQDQPIEFYHDRFRFGFRGFRVEWEEWNNGEEEKA